MKKAPLLRPLAWLIPVIFLSACKTDVLAPAGDVALQQRDILIIATLLMLIIIIPVMIMICWFAWRYRASNTRAAYRPNWDHSTKLELAIWGFPVLIIVALGALTWVSTHLTDPYRPLGRISAERPLDGQKPLEVEVVALDWKWLFIYPEQGVASVNELALPVDRPVRFRLTASSVMNAFYLPTMAGMIYAMPGMETTLNGVINEEGTYKGIASHYSGAGFSGMHFQTHVYNAKGFDDWIETTRTGESNLDRQEYLALERPSENVPPRRFATVDPQLYDRIVNLCVEPGKICMAEMMALDAKGGIGLAGTTNLQPLPEGPNARTAAREPVLGWQPFLVTGFCTPEELAQMFGNRPQWSTVQPGDPTPLRGQGMNPPSSPFSPDWGTRITRMLPSAASETNL
ncbi:ubiquinol oxidase subunit II [Paracoccus aminophilus]|nr:ubiquinol oxidase subunit II [Paracoccus aminophilus]